MSIKATRANRKALYICPACGCTGHGKITMPGSRFTEIFLWVVLLFPGPLYSLWRHASRKLVCPRCDNDYMLRLESPGGKILFEDLMSGKTVLRPRMSVSKAGDRHF